MRLRHIHLPSPSSQPPSPFPSYALASQIQEHLRRALLASKSTPGLPTPPPTLLTFTPLPTYTLGRRQQTTPLSTASVARLTAPLTTPFGTFTPSIHASPRGGLTTYHGPGQLVVWPVVDLISASHRHFTVRTYACQLERTTIAVLRSLFAIRAHTIADHPGVWVPSPSSAGDADGEAEAAPARKIAAVGVHLRRHVAALGTAVNLDSPPGTAAADDEAADPWARFVPCGLEGKGVTSVAREAEGSGTWPPTGGGVSAEEIVAAAWAEEFARGIGVEGVERVDGGDVCAVLGVERIGEEEE